MTVRVPSPAQTWESDMIQSVSSSSETVEGPLDGAGDDAEGEVVEGAGGDGLGLADGGEGSGGQRGAGGALEGGGEGGGVVEGDRAELLGEAAHLAAGGHRHVGRDVEVRRELDGPALVEGVEVEDDLSVGPEGALGVVGEDQAGDRRLGQGGLGRQEATGGGGVGEILEDDQARGGVVVGGAG